MQKTTTTTTTTTTEFQQHVSMPMEKNTDTTNLLQVVKQEGIISTNDMLPLNTAVKRNQNENEMLGYHF